jgi:hypothetical protein
MRLTCIYLPKSPYPPGITLPHVLELLFDGTAEVHRAMLDLLSALLTKYTANDFSSLVPVLVTYICSGLTSLNLVSGADFSCLDIFSFVTA